MRQYRSLATVIEEVAVQSRHRSLAAVKNCQRAAIVIVKEVAPQNQRRFLMRQHCSLATVVEEVSAQSCHRSLTTIKNSRRMKDVGGVGNNQSNREIFGTIRRGSQTRNKQREYGQRKFKWGGMISSTHMRIKYHYNQQ